MNTTITIGRTIELTSSEKRKLKSMVLGYGKLIEAARKAGLHVNTLRLVIIRGYAEPDTIKIIRQKLLAGNVETITQ